MTSKSKIELYRLKSTDWIKLTNLIPIPTQVNSSNNYCNGCHTYSCSRKGQPNHSPLLLQPSPHSFLRGIENWELKGTSCLTFGQSVALHVEASLSQGNNLDVVRLTLNLKPCPGLSQSQRNSNQTLSPTTCDQIQDVQVEIQFANDRTESVKFITMHAGNSWDSFQVVNDFFLPMTTFRGLCKKGKNSLSGTGEEFEYVDAYMDVNILAKADKILVLPAACTTLFQQEKAGMAISSTLLDQDGPSWQTGSTSSPSSPGAALTNDTVIFALGEELEEVAVHKDILIEKSEVFRTMFETEMEEGASNMVRLPEVSPEAMTAFAKCLYSMKFPRDMATTMEVLKLAHKYQICDIIQEATRLLIMTKEPMDLILALEVFSLGSRMDISDLEFRALQWLKENKDSASSAAGKDIIHDFMKINFDLLPAFLGWLL